MLLTRDEFRNKVFERDQHRCVICGNEVKDGVKLDAHHIIERRLWSDGGYYLDNGATLCDRGNSNGFPMGCHSDAEVTTLSVEDIRIAAGIEKIALPEDMYSDHVYDKWGNIVLDNGKRTKGPLFYDESVQKFFVIILTSMIYLSSTSSILALIIFRGALARLKMIGLSKIFLSLKVNELL